MDKLFLKAFLTKRVIQIALLSAASISLSACDLKGDGGCIKIPVIYELCLQLNGGEEGNGNGNNGDG